MRLYFAAWLCFRSAALAKCSRFGFHYRINALNYHATTNHGFYQEFNDAVQHLIELLPVTILFDYASAFPSVPHRWIRAILHKIRIARGLLNAFNMLYHGNEAYSFVGGVFRWIFSIKSGVLQGCPVSGSLFGFKIDL